ncbi:MAG TPA: type IV pilus secretin PilQ [Terriglobia bacterium]|nr:type IV pilus secretin PilQ [Terriglobia bacterium]
MRLCDYRKFTITFVFVAAMTLVVQAASPTDAFVKDVAFSSSGRSLEARITLSETARFTYFELEGPHRLVVDFHGLKNGIAFTQKNIASAGVTRVRTSYFTAPDRSATRIVFDLDKSVNYRVVDDGAGVVRVVFENVDAPEFINIQVPTNLIAGPPVLPKEEPTPTLSRVRLESSSPTVKVAGLQDPAAQAGAAVTAAAATAATATAGTGAGTTAAAGVEPAVVVARQAPTAQAEPPQQLSPRITVAAGPQAPAVTGPAVPQTFNGEPIDLDLKQADLGDFFRLVAEISGLNVIVDQNVTGNVTVTLKDVPWDQALDIILRNHNLAGILEGKNVLRIATRQALQAEDAQRRAARDAAQAAIPPIAKSYVLNYPKAEDVARTLLNSRMLSQRGTVATEVRRNAIIVTDVAEQFDGIEKLIQFMDTPAQQVEIEARLLQANKSFSRELGTQLGLLVGANTGNVVAGGQGEGSPFERTPPPRVTAGGGGGLPLLTNLPAAATSGIAFLMQPGSDILLDAIITAAEANGNARLLSQPKVVTESNVRAEIEQGTQIPVQTNVNNTITTTYLTFALRLEVTPQVTEDGTIVMEVDIENSQPDLARTVSGIPVVGTQHARTRRTVPDGATMMLGGIFVDTDSLNVRQVPGLGSIPIIGHLFKNTQTIKSQAELFFFITPRIRKPDAVAPEVARNN